MLRKECDCGRVLYMDVERCPCCGRGLLRKPLTAKPVNNSQTIKYSGK